MTLLKKVTKSLRAWAPLNFVATSAARGITRTIGWQPDFLPHHLHRVGSVTCAIPGGGIIKLWSRGDDWVSNRLFWFGFEGYEPESATLFAALARTSRGTLDVGAYVGFYSLVAANVNRHAPVHAFEPMPAIFERLQNHIRINALANVFAHRFAVSDTNGSAEFFFPNDSPLPTSSSLSATYTDNVHLLVSTTVPVIRLDDFARQQGLKAVDLMKIDTETTELSVLRGAQEILSRDRPNIVCEVLADRAPAAGMMEMLTPLGYRFYLLTPQGPVPRSSIVGHPEYLNYLFTTLDETALRARLAS
jgi:FkbM family methyltransferase